MSRRKDNRQIGLIGTAAAVEYQQNNISGNVKYLCLKGERPEVGQRKTRGLLHDAVALTVNTNFLAFFQAILLRMTIITGIGVVWPNPETL